MKKANKAKIQELHHQMNVAEHRAVIRLQRRAQRKVAAVARHAKAVAKKELRTKLKLKKAKKKIQFLDIKSEALRRLDARKRYKLKKHLKQKAAKFWHKQIRR